MRKYFQLRLTGDLTADEMPKLPLTHHIRMYWNGRESYCVFTVCTEIEKRNVLTWSDNISSLSHTHTHAKSLNKWTMLSPSNAQIKIKRRHNIEGCFTSVQDQHCNTVNIQFNVEYVLLGACRPKLDKTGITLIDEIIIARALTPPRSLHGISLLEICTIPDWIAFNSTARRLPFFRTDLKTYILLELFQPSPVSQALFWPIRPKKQIPTQCPQLSLSQFYFHKMTSSLPNHDKEEWVYPPLSHYPSLSSPPPLRTHGCRCADMQPNQSNKRPVIT